MEILRLRDLAQNYTVLYVEDEEDIRQIFMKTLGRLFKTVYVAEDGEMGYNSFLENSPDIVITDIKMPKLSGIDMSSMIRQKDMDIPIIIISAFHDTNFLVEAIELKIDFFIFKPLIVKKMLDTIERVLVRIEDKKTIDDYKRKEAIFQLNNASLNGIFNTMEGFAAPSLLIDENNRLLYLNKAWEKFLDRVWLTNYIDGKVDFTSIIKTDNGFIDSLNELSNGSHIIINRGKQHLYFIVQTKELVFDGDIVNYKLYTFTDITMLEYQKNKLQTMNRLLKDFMLENYYDCPRHIEVKKVDDRLLNDKERDILRKHHNKIYTAIEYIRELDIDTIQEIDELEEIESEIRDLIDELEVHMDSKLLEKVSLRLYKYSLTLKLLFEFNDLCFAITSISELLEKQSLISIEERIMSKIILYIKNIMTDLESWRRVIFVEKTALDIHYMDSSLFSACLQLEMMLSNKHIDDDNFFELF